MGVTITFQMRFSGWVLRASSQARTAISLVPSRSSTSTSNDQKHQHQYFPYFVAFSGWSSVHTCHVSPPSSVTSTLVTFLPPPARTTTPLPLYTLSNYKTFCQVSTDCLPIAVQVAIAKFHSKFGVLYLFFS